MVEISSHKQPLLNFRGAVALVIANTIGTGVFTTSGFALADLGSPLWVLLAWLVGGIYALCGVVVYADLATRVPLSGGEYVFLRHTMHPAMGTIAGWISLIAGFSAPIAAAALAAQQYAAHILPIDVSKPWLASLVVLSMASLHALKPNAGVNFQNTAVLIKVLAILLFIGFGISHAADKLPLAPASLTPLSPLAFLGSLVWISFAYSGWNAAVYVTGDIKGGGVTVKRALYTGTMLVIALYMGVSTVILFATPPAAIWGIAESGAAAAFALGGLTAEKALSAVITLALLTSVSSMVLSGPRVYAQMAQHGTLPTLLATAPGQQPRLAIILQALLCLLLVWSASLRQLLEFAGFMLSMSAAFVVIGWLKYLRHDPKPATSIQRLAATLFLLASAGICMSTLQQHPESIAVATVVVLIGLAAHYASNGFKKHEV
jgi:APA family basic amino acid/polyamine antiporter